MALYVNGKNLMFAVWATEKEQGRVERAEPVEWHSHCVWNRHENNVSAAGKL